MRRPCVTPFPFVAVLLITVGGAACVGEENVTACYYEEDGVREPCEVFQKAECKENLTSSYISYALTTGKIDERTYHNVTLSLWVTEGYLTAPDVGECWQFRTGGTRYPNRIVKMIVENFPGSEEEAINVFTDGHPCAYMYNGNYSFQIHTEKNETTVKFTFQPDASIEEVQAVLLGGECEITCNGSYNKCVLFERRSLTMKNFSEFHNFTGLRHGYYCIRFQRGVCISHTYTKPSPTPMKDPPPPDSSSDDSNIVVISLSITGVAVVVILVVFLKRSSYSTLQQLLETEEQDGPTQWQSIHQHWASSPEPCKILLLYSRDCRKFCDVVQALSCLLKSFGKLEVLDPMEQNQMEEVSENIPGWLTQHLQNPDVRVVIVVSEGAKLRQRALLNNQIVHAISPHFLDPVYTQALQQMHEDPSLGSSYTRIFPVRFEDFTPSEESLSLIVPLKCYILQKHLGKLIVELRGFNTPTSPDLEDIRSICPKEMDELESTIRIMKLYFAANPYYIKEHFSFVVPST